MIENKQLPPNNSPNLNATDVMSGERRTKLFWNLHPKPKTVYELKSRTGEDIGLFSAGTINKAFPSFIEFDKVREG